MNLRSILSCLLCVALVIPPTWVPAFASDKEQITNELVSTLKAAATQGYFANPDKYNELIKPLEKLEGRDLKTHPLSTQERDDLLALLKEIRDLIPEWIGRLVEGGQRLEEEGIVAFKNANWAVLEKECKEVALSDSRESPIDGFIKGLETVQAGGEFDWGTLQEDLRLESSDCGKHLGAILKQVEEVDQRLGRELEILEQKIASKEAECDKETDPARATECEQALSTLYEEYEDKYEQRTKTKKFKDQSKFNMAMLGYLAMAIGVAVGVWCCPDIGASIAAWGGKTLDENQDWMEERTATERVKKGRSRKLSNAEDPAPGEREKLQNQLQKDGFDVVPVSESEGKIPFEILISQNEIRVYLVKGHRLVAVINEQNTTVLPNFRSVAKIFNVAGFSVVGNVFVEDNLLRLNVNASGPDGQPIKLVISEKAVGSKTHTLTVDE